MNKVIYLPIYMNLVINLQSLPIKIKHFIHFKLQNHFKFDKFCQIQTLNSYKKIVQMFFKIFQLLLEQYIKSIVFNFHIF